MVFTKSLPSSCVYTDRLAKQIADYTDLKGSFIISGRNRCLEQLDSRIWAPFFQQIRGNPVNPCSSVCQRIFKLPAVLAPAV